MYKLGIINDNGLIIPCFLENTDFELHYLHLEKKWEDIAIRMFEDFWLEDYWDNIYVNEEEVLSEIMDIPDDLDIIYAYANARNYKDTLKAIDESDARVYIIECDRSIKDKEPMAMILGKLQDYHVVNEVLNISKTTNINYNKESNFIIAAKDFTFSFDNFTTSRKGTTFKRYIEYEDGYRSITDSEREKFTKDITSKIEEEDEDRIFWIWKRSYARKIKSDRLPGIYEVMGSDFNIQTIPFYCDKHRPEKYEFISPSSFLNLVGFENSMMVMREFSRMENVFNYSYALSCPLLCILEQIATEVIEQIEEEDA